MHYIKTSSRELVFDEYNQQAHTKRLSLRLETKYKNKFVKQRKGRKRKVEGKKTGKVENWKSDDTEKITHRFTGLERNLWRSSTVSICIQINEKSSFLSDTLANIWVAEVEENLVVDFTEAWNFAEENYYCERSVCTSLLFSQIHYSLLTKLLKICSCTRLFKWMHYFYLHGWKKWWFQANSDYNLSSILVGCPYCTRLQLRIVQVVSKERHTEQLISTTLKN